MLTATETGLIELLLRRSPAVVARRTIAVQVWEDEAEAVGSNTIDVHVARLRAKLTGSDGAHQDGAWHRVPASSRSEAGAMTRRSARWVHAAKVASVATAVVAAVALVAALVLNAVFVDHLSHDIDAQLAARLSNASEQAHTAVEEPEPASRRPR